MSAFAAGPPHKRLPYGYRAQLARTVLRLIEGALKLSDLKDAEKEDIVAFLEQTAALYDRLKPAQQEVEAVLARHAKAGRPGERSGGWP